MLASIDIGTVPFTSVQNATVRGHPEQGPSFSSFLKRPANYVVRTADLVLEGEAGLFWLVVGP